MILAGINQHKAASDIRHDANFILMKV